MVRFILFLLILINSSPSFSEENLLTLKQQIDRLQREVNDLSKLVYSNNVKNNSGNNINNNSEDVDQVNTSNISAFDMRIYDIEKEIKSLHSSIENIVFEIDGIKVLFDDLNLKINDTIISNNQTIKSSEINSDLESEEKSEEISDVSSENTLGTIKINSQDLSDDTQDNQTDKIQDANVTLNPDEQFQLAFDLLRAQKFKQAKNSLEEFISKNPENALAGSAHYWLGEIYLLQKDYREAALIFAEGYQKHPKSIKAPDMLYKLSEALSKIDKKIEACNTLFKFKKDYSNHKLIDNINSKYEELKCD